MEPNERRAELIRRGIQIKDIASDLGIAAASVSQVIANTKRTYYVRAAIAKAIGKPVEEVFPSQETA
jgi:predicted transcriptional regulator